jgi:hypothetical protein
VSDSQSYRPLVDEGHLYAWQVRVREIDEQFKTLSVEKDRLLQLIGMAETLSAQAHLLAAATGSDSLHPKFLNDALRELEETDAFPKAVMTVVERHEDGATYDDIREALLRSPLGKKLRKSDKGFYHALRRLKDSKSLVDHHGYVFTPANLTAFLKKVAAGLKQDKAVDRGRATQMMDLILETVARNPGLTAKDVIQIIRSQSAELDAKLSNNDGSAYNAIARFKRRGIIEAFGHLDRQLRIGAKADDSYKRLARSAVVLTMPKRSEAPSGKAIDASENGPLFGSAPRS